MSPEPSAGAVTALVYRSLVRDTLLPSDPHVVGAAALGVLRPGESLPAGFGADVEADAAWLAARVTGPEVPWGALKAMSFAADKPHTNVAHESFSRALNAVPGVSAPTAPGLGMWRQANAGMVVARVDAGGSAAASGLARGDLVVGIDGARPRPSGQHAAPLHGAPEGTLVALDIERGGRELALTLRLGPGPVVPLTPRLLDGGVGYLDIPWFASSDDPSYDTAALVRSALAGFAAEGDGVRGLIVDLRSGMGGNLKAVREILSALTGAAEVVALTSEDGQPVAYTRAGEQVWPDLPIAVLVNEQTVSAGEALAIGLEELASAALVGEPTAGGLNVMRFVELTDGYRMVLPDRPMLGPRSLVGRPGHRLEPTVSVPNPTAAEVAGGVDAQLGAALEWLAAR